MPSETWWQASEAIGLSLGESEPWKLLSLAAHREGRPVHERILTGYAFDEPRFRDACLDLGAVTAFDAIYPAAVEQIYSWPWALARCRSQGEGDGSVWVWDASPEGGLAGRVAEIARKCLRPTPPENSVSVLVATQSGYQVHSAGSVGVDLERGNYSGEVLAPYDHLVGCLRSAEPCGRLAILEGPPGTGKSYLIRSLPLAASGIYIVVPAALVGQLGGPEVIPALLSARPDCDTERLPIVLILEDADDALIRRERTDRGKVSEILNLGDGLLGSLMDIRLICTTNTGIVDWDPAIQRPGRLCTHLTFGELMPHRCDSIRERLVGDGTPHPLDAERTLAVIYRTARRDGWPGPPPAPPGRGNYL